MKRSPEAVNRKLSESDKGTGEGGWDTLRNWWLASYANDNGP